MQITQTHLLSVYIRIYTMDDIYENIDYYNPTRKRKKLIAFGDMIANIMDNRRF